MQSRNTGIQRAGPWSEVPPRVVIYAESGSTAEDLEACLAGPYTVEATTSLAGAVEALGDPAAALLVVPTDDLEPMGDWSTLLHRALIRECRVMVLGPTGTTLEKTFGNSVQTYPAMPEPAHLHRDLTELIA